MLRIILVVYIIIEVNFNFISAYDITVNNFRMCLNTHAAIALDVLYYILEASIFIICGDTLCILYCFSMHAVRAQEMSRFVYDTKV